MPVRGENEAVLAYYCWRCGKNIPPQETEQVMGENGYFLICKQHRVEVFVNR
jgi:DNA-directed RNA polymerase subunit RPC12/RpoP